MEKNQISQIIILFSEHGINRFSREQIAKKIGMNYDEFHKEFPDEKTLLQKIVGYFSDNVFEYLIENQKIYDDAIENLYASIKIYSNPSNPKKHLLLSQLEFNHPELFQEIRLKIFERASIFLDYNIQFGIEQGYVVKNLNRNFHMRTYLYLLFSANFSSFFSNPEQEQEVDTQITELYLNSICTKKGLLKLEELRANFNLKE